MRHSAKKSICDTQLFNVHTPASTLRTHVSVKNVPWDSDRAGGGRRAHAHVLQSPAALAGKGLSLSPSGFSAVGHVPLPRPSGQTSGRGTTKVQYYRDSTSTV